MPSLETSKRQEKEQRITRERLKRYGDMEDGLSQSNKIAKERAREEIWSYLDKLMTNGQTDRRTYRAIP